MAFVSDEMIHKSFPKEKKSIILSLKWRMSYIISPLPPPLPFGLWFARFFFIVSTYSNKVRALIFHPISPIFFHHSKNRKKKKKNTRTQRLTCVYSPTGRPAGVVAGQVPSSVWRIPNRRTNTKFQRIRINSCLQAAVYGRNRRVINVGATKIDWNIKRE